jgi:arylsulfatase A-like enzyme
MYDDVDIPEPETFYDDYSHRASAAEAARMRVGRDMNERDWKLPVPEGLSPLEDKRWKYQRYIKDYLRVIASIDDNVGRLLDYLHAEGLADDTMVVYTSDQGFFLGDHGWFDKRFMYEESLRMPFIVRYPREVAAGSITEDIVTNVDFAPMFLDLADVPAPAEFQGRSFRDVLRGRTPDDWPTSMYYRYWMHNDSNHHVYAHYGVRTKRYKLIYYYNDPLGQDGALGPSFEPEWELLDLETDPCEMHSVHDDPAYAAVMQELKDELHLLQAQVGDERYPKDVD